MSDLLGADRAIGALVSSSRRTARVAIPRPKGTRATSRATLTITMHPRELEALEGRARAASMSLTAYVRALLESDREDVPGANRPRSRFSLGELASDGALVGAGVLHHRGEPTPETLEAVANLIDRVASKLPPCPVAGCIGKARHFGAHSDGRNVIRVERGLGPDGETCNCGAGFGEKHRRGCVDGCA